VLEAEVRFSARFKGLVREVGYVGESGNGTFVELVGKSVIVIVSGFLDFLTRIADAGFWLETVEYVSVELVVVFCCCFTIVRASRKLDFLFVLGVRRCSLHRK